MCPESGDMIELKYDIHIARILTWIPILGLNIKKVLILTNIMTSLDFWYISFNYTNMSIFIEHYNKQ